jgi:hypothetical protein
VILFPGLRVEWLKTRARAERWREELQLLDEEMRRALQYCWWKAQWWKQRADTATAQLEYITEGIRAYALEQGNAEQRRAIRWSSRWSAVRERARDVLAVQSSNVDATDRLPQLIVELAEEEDREGQLDESEGEDEED